MNFEKELVIAKKAALNASKRVMEFYSLENIEINKKDDDSPLTKADLAANEIILKELKKEFPEYGFLSEESVDDKTRCRKEFVWVIDPIDGTKEFISKNGEFTVNIGLVKNGKPVLGVIVVPAKNLMYYSVQGEGSYKQDIGSDAVKKISVSQRFETNELVLVHSRSHPSKEEELLIAEHKFGNVKKRGSSLKGCLVAEGGADIYLKYFKGLGRMYEWDICAMTSILLEAGGKITNLNGEDITFNNETPKIRDGFICTNGKVHDKTIQMINETIKNE